MSGNAAFLPPSTARLPVRLLRKQKSRHLLSPQRNAVIATTPTTRRPLHVKASGGAPSSTASDKQPDALLLVDHGSRRSEANDMLSQVVDMLQTRLSIPVHMAHMELAAPSIANGIDSCVDNGAKHIIILPFFLSPGRHTTVDIPELAAEATAKYTGITHEVRPPIGTHPAVVDILMDRAGLL